MTPPYQDRGSVRDESIPPNLTWDRQDSSGRVDHRLTLLSREEWESIPSELRPLGNWDNSRRYILAEVKVFPTPENLG